MITVINFYQHPHKYNIITDSENCTCADHRGFTLDITIMVSTCAAFGRGTFFDSTLWTSDER